MEKGPLCRICGQGGIDDLAAAKMVASSRHGRPVLHALSSPASVTH